MDIKEGVILVNNISTVWLTTNRSCNNACDWCYAKKSENQLAKMDLAGAMHCVDLAKNMGAKKIILIGGEPTLYENLITLVSYIHSKNMQVWIATNGRKLADFSFAQSLANAGADRFDLSLKATTEQEYMLVTHNYGLSEFLIGYENLAKLGFYPNVSYVIVDDRMDKIDEIIEIVQQNNIRNITLQFVKPVVQLNSEKIMDIQTMGIFASKVYHKMLNVDTNFKIEISFPLCVINSDDLVHMINNTKINTCCHIQRGNGVVFDTEFKILPCNHFVNFPFKNESLRMCSLEELENFLNSENITKFRRMSRNFPSIKCSKCKLWNLCGGGCFTRWFYINPQSEIPGFQDDGQWVLNNLYNIDSAR